MSYLEYGKFTRDELLKKIQERVSEKRYKHMLGVEKSARELAERFGVNCDKAGLAGLLHDYAKELSDQDFLQLITEKNLDPDLKNWGNNIWHGLVGSYVVASELGITNDEILRAIALHTTGSKDMTDLDKIVYVADYIEENRQFPGVDRAREIACVSLNQVVAYETAHTISHLANKGIPIYPKTLETYNYFVNYLEQK